MVYILFVLSLAIIIDIGEAEPCGRHSQKKPYRKLLVAMAKFAKNIKELADILILWN